MMRSQKQYVYNTTSARQTRKLGESLAKELKGGEILALTGELGSGKTTFAQGILKGLGAKGPYTSPTFVVMKEYKLEAQNSERKITAQKSRLKNVYHIDAYRVGARDILNLGWKEIISDKHNVIIIEWAERVKRIIPERAVWVKLEHLKDDKRKLVLKY